MDTPSPHSSSADRDAAGASAGLAADRVPDSAADGPLLDLDTLIVRPTIAITHEGKRHVVEILSPDELSIIDSHRFGQWGRRIHALAEAEGDDAEAELSALIDTVARRVAVGVAPEIFSALSGAHRQAICDVFTGLLLRNRLGVAGAIARAAGIGTDAIDALAAGQRTGARPSPGLSGSMAGRRTGGWSKRLARWFGLS